MATGALVTDQTAEGHVEDVKLINDIKDVEKESLPESKDLEGKDEEKIKVDDSADVEASATQSEAAIVPEEKQEEKSEPVTEEVKEAEKSEPVMEEVNKEAEDEKTSEPFASDAIEQEETSKQEADSSPPESKEEADSLATVEPAVEAVEKELESQVDVTDPPEPPKPSIEASVEDSEATLVQELVSETAKEPAVPEAAAEKVNTIPEAAAEEVNTNPEAAAELVTAEELLQAASVSETESKETELPTVSAVTEPSPDAADDVTPTGVSEIAETSQSEAVSDKPEENTEFLKEELLVTDSNKLEEVSDNVPEAVVSESADTAAPVKELKEIEEAAVTEEVPNVLESAKGDKNAFATAGESDTKPAVESIESLVKPEVEAEEEMQEKAVLSEKLTMGDTTKTDAATQVSEVPSEGPGGGKVEDKKEAIAEGSVDSSKDLDATAEVPKVSSEGERASEGVEEKKDESLEGEKATLIETSRDIDVEADNSVSEKTEKDDEKTPAESAKDAGEAPKAEAPAKSSQRQSSNIFSKVKQSIVKVKKAIVGKSPSSKTMSAEGKDEIKVK